MIWIAAGSAGTAKADGVYYAFGPISYDLTALPAMENALYAAWEGRIYSQKLKTQGDTESMVVYSCALDGSDVTE